MLSDVAMVLSRHICKSQDTRLKIDRYDNRHNIDPRTLKQQNNNESILFIFSESC